ncbi:hypothetical protein CSE16_15430 [Solibacillus sp. R5-41]|uniref:hypothetical protein n=1 Tax=Solibacillus sp. R5-41 TaxID=2048654 RepID=UPI000C1266F2|nr:hypothetical protein [Solibacillus sp. R5-41]ATP41336.1 hypothetical protein CSE16_15430 [Solibacillus sp. R5-41]
MNINTSYQVAVELNVINWDATNIGVTITEVRDSQKIYTNDIVEIQQVVDFGRVTERSHKILIIFNLTRDLDNLGEKIIL